MIGRRDITFRSETPAQVLEGAVRIVRAAWKEAMVEDAETGELLDLDSLSVAALPAELLIYKNANARASWTAHGAIAANENSMLHVLRGDESITVVVDDPDRTEMACILGAIRDCVYQDIFWIRAHAA